MKCSKALSRRSAVPSVLVILLAAAVGPVSADLVSVNSSQDNTLYEYEPIAPHYDMRSNGSGDFFSAGRNYSRSEIRRGLIRFNLPSLAPGSYVVPGTATLQLQVIDVPKQDGTPRPFWLVPLTGLNEPWGEGASVANAGGGGGSGAPAQEGDATWFYTSYDPAVHDKTAFHPGNPGFWAAEGALGADPLDPWTQYGAPTATVGGLGTVAFSSPGMEADINAWLADPASNFGWIVLGDETIGSTTESSSRGFATREHANLAFRPLLTFESVVPEPSAVVLLLTGLVPLVWRWFRKPPFGASPPTRRGPAGAP